MIEKNNASIFKVCLDRTVSVLIGLLTYSVRFLLGNRITSTVLRLHIVMKSYISLGSTPHNLPPLYSVTLRAERSSKMQLFNSLLSRMTESISMRSRQEGLEAPHLQSHTTSQRTSFPFNKGCINTLQALPRSQRTTINTCTIMNFFPTNTLL